nr:redoxin domain-containing protein [Rubritalea squalenifaciens]
MLGLFSLLSAASQAGEVKVGEVAPDFELKNQDGKVVKLSDYKGKKKVVLVFSRGHW